MSSIVTAARVLLEEFVRSDWRDLYLRTRDGTIFIAKPGGAENPLRKGGSPQNAADSAAGLILAPHVATVDSVRELHSRVEAGDVVVTLTLLGERIDVKSPIEGVLAEVFVRSGELAEYKQPLVGVAAAAVTSPPPPRA